MSPRRRIVSFLPSATEMAFALGLGDQICGISHECDYPPEARTKPVMVHNALPIERMSQREIDVAVTERLRQGLSLYTINEALLQQTVPDLILTQNLCEVCAPAGNEISQALRLLPTKPEILWLTPKSIEGIFDNLTELAAATGRERQAEALIEAARARLDTVKSVAARAEYRPRVFCMEWMDPVYCCGHWVPEMVDLAGGIDALGRLGTDSVRIAWQDVLDWVPEVLVVMPCGFNLDQAIGLARQLPELPGWQSLPAVREGRVYVVDANAYFARPGPRVVDGTELLAHLIHPELFDWPGRPPAFHRLDGDPPETRSEVGSSLSFSGAA
jgi:iron complex transport system substrate-binding protein